MPTDFLPFSIGIDTALIAGSCLWSLALYVGFPRWRDRAIDLLDRWFNFAERSLYTSQQEFDRTRRARESMNAFYASICSIVPFLLLGGLCNWGIETGLGQSWSVSTGTIACIVTGIYELGRQDGQR